MGSPFLGLQSWLSNQSLVPFLDGLKPHVPTESPLWDSNGSCVWLSESCDPIMIQKGEECIVNIAQLVLEEKEQSEL